MQLREKYGQWAVVAGGSEGMGGDYSTYAAEQGMNVAVIGRHSETVEAKCEELRGLGVDALPLVADLGTLDAHEAIEKATSTLDVGLLIYNAGWASLAPFTSLEMDTELYRINVNVRSALALSLHYSKLMQAKGKGAIILMSSSGGVVGTPYIQTYSATKAYLFTLAEALWAELKDYGIDVLGVLPGNTIGQNYRDVPAGTPGFQTGREVVEIAFEALGKQSSVLSGDTTIATVGKYFDRELREEGVLMMKGIFDNMMKSM